MPAGLRYFAVRRVNPFDGVLQVVETGTARAYSPDGRVWQIQVLAQRPDHTWRSFSDMPAVQQFFNFGLWDAADGLHRIPANPVLDIGGMTLAAQALCAQLESLESELPFTLTDEFECWSTDADGRPIALLATSEDEQLLRDIRIGAWQATRPADRGFVAPSLLARGIPAQGATASREHGERLERQVRQLDQGKAWFRRHPDNLGEQLDPAAAAVTTQTELPPLGLRLDWEGDGERQLVEDYIAWQAPRLLMLQHIDDATRARLEALACRRAVELEAGHRLLPRVIDHERIEAARVEARLRRASV
ncbi:MAG: hypothetical protein KDI82_12505 [Gammaproteobacteria bacterium]|nr:hypothetical protein [Gammaproteobacteria bacterium]